MEKLIESALRVREKAYCPYSEFKVGAAALFEDGKIYTGCNIENVSYSATVCAERTAIFNGVSNGNRKLKAIAIAGSRDNFTFPCGICRQVMIEFAESDKIIIYIIKDKDNIITKTLGQLMPDSFSKKDLNT